MISTQLLDCLARNSFEHLACLLQSNLWKEIPRKTLPESCNLGCCDRYPNVGRRKYSTFSNTRVSVSPFKKVIVVAAAQASLCRTQSWACLMLVLNVYNNLAQALLVWANCRLRYPMLSLPDERELVQWALKSNQTKKMIAIRLEKWGRKSSYNYVAYYFSKFGNLVKHHLITVVRAINAIFCPLSHFNVTWSML